MAATFESFRHRWWPPSLDFGRGVVVPPPRLFTWAMRLLCCAALAVTGYLAVTALREGEVAGCAGGAVWDCELALHSRWAKIFAVPVSIPAFALYAVVLIALCFCRPTATRSTLRLAWGIATVGAIADGLAAIWFISLQVFALGHLCVYCLAAHLCGLALCAAILWMRPLGSRATASLTGLSVLGISFLIGGQVFSAPPQTFKVEYYPPAPQVASNAPAAAASDSGAKHQQRKPEVFEAPADAPDDAGEK
jgi:uncharacterized membrane protein